eukprot:TRINITY_DN278_c2_g1_i1.p2 TRINITY_DN278_c2_g1~~TRINITY_DN278_c2_g1_i1.p2  ORF type:complete len:152 (-),score=32.75 TRINITY_DN278_c2_g1_i1:9-464(-)
MATNHNNSNNENNNRRYDPRQSYAPIQVHYDSCYARKPIQRNSHQQRYLFIYRACAAPRTPLSLSISLSVLDHRVVHPMMLTNEDKHNKPCVHTHTTNQTHTKHKTKKQNKKKQKNKKKTNQQVRTATQRKASGDVATRVHKSRSNRSNYR